MSNNTSFMNRIICDSGAEGWQQTLRENYNDDFQEFLTYDDTYAIARRLGFNSAEEAWAKNPMIQGSINPSDFRRSGVMSKHMELIKFFFENLLHRGNSVEVNEHHATFTFDLEEQKDYATLTDYLNRIPNNFCYTSRMADEKDCKFTHIVVVNMKR